MQIFTLFSSPISSRKSVSCGKRDIHISINTATVLLIANLYMFVSLPLTLFASENDMHQYDIRSILCSEKASLFNQFLPIEYIWLRVF